MRFLIALLLALLLLAVLSGVASANDYTYRDGYWYDSHGQAYTRYQTKCYRGRCWYYCWQYTPYYAKPNECGKPVDWRAAIVKLAENQKAAADALEAAKEENKAFNEALGALGLKGSTYVGGLPPLQGLPLGGFLVSPSGKSFDYRQVIQSGFNAEQGETLFSVSQLSDIYSQNDLSVLFQQAQQLAEGSQRLAGDATSQFDSLVEKEAAGRQRIAEIIAKTQLVRETLRNASPPVRDEREITIADSEALATDVKSLLASRCLRCHNTATEKNGKVDLTKYDTFTDDEKAFVFETVASGKMPKGGKRLTGKEMRLLAK